MEKNRLRYVTFDVIIITHPRTYTTRVECRRRRRRRGRIGHFTPAQGENEDVSCVGSHAPQVCSVFVNPPYRRFCSTGTACRYLSKLLYGLKFTVTRLEMEISKKKNRRHKHRRRSYLLI